jgi:hypothetical protein
MEVSSMRHVRDLLFLIPTFVVPLRNLFLLVIGLGASVFLIGLGIQTFHLAVPLEAIIGWVIALSIVWLIIRWCSPWYGSFGYPDEERALLRILERELSRSLRYKEPLVITLLESRRGLSLPKLRKFLRVSDIVLRGRSSHYIILLTETPYEEGRDVIRRLISSFPIRLAVIAHEGVVMPAVGLMGFDARYQHRHITHRPTFALLRGLRLGHFRASLSVRHNQPPPLYEVKPSDIILTFSSTHEKVFEEFTNRVA